MQANNLSCNDADVTLEGNSLTKKKMKTMIIRIFLLLIISINTFGQIDQDALSQRVKSAAITMGNVFLAGDHEKFVDFMYPEVVSKLGGKEKIVQALVDGQTQMEKDGVSFENVEFDEPSYILERNKTLQCIIPQTITMKVRGGTLKTRTGLFAISEDNGQNWTFLDLSKKTQEQVLAIVPVFHTEPPHLQLF